MQLLDEAQTILHGLVNEGDAAEAELNAPVVTQSAPKKAPETKQQPAEEQIDFDASDVQIRFVDMSIPREKPHYKGMSQVRKGDVAGEFLSNLLSDGAQAEQNIEDLTAAGAVRKQAREAAYAQKQALEEDGQFYDDSEVQLQFVEQDDTKFNDELAQYKKSTSSAEKAF